MQRQSLGSPSSKLHGHGRGPALEVGAASPSVSSPSASPVTVPGVGTVDIDDVKHEKLHRRRSSSPSLHSSGPEKLIHLIPALIVLCFLVLFLCSHEPSPTDLAQFYGFKHPQALADSREIDNLEQAQRKGEIIAIRSLRNLQEISKEVHKKSRSHRKLADF